MKFNFSGIKQKNETILSLDVGTSAVKGIIFQKQKQEQVILAAGSEYFSDFSNTGNLELEARAVGQTILKVLELLKAKTGALPKRTFLLLSPKMLRERTIYSVLARKQQDKIISKKEKEQICQELLAKSQELVLSDFAKASGILPQDIHIFSFKILEQDIDGYMVPDILAKNGRKVGFKILFSFSPRFYWDILPEKILPALVFNKIKLLSPSQGVQAFLQKQKIQGLLVDVGEEVSQVFWVSQGEIKGVFEFNSGGELFLRQLRDVFGLSKKEARIWQKRYSHGLFSKGALQRIKQVFCLSKKEWAFEFRSGLQKMNPDIQNVFLWGGASRLPEISQALKQELAGAAGLEIKFLYPKDLNHIKVLPELAGDIQYVPCLLNCFF